MDPPWFKSPRLKSPVVTFCSVSKIHHLNVRALDINPQHNTDPIGFMQTKAEL